MSASLAMSWESTGADAEYKQPHPDAPRSTFTPDEPTETSRRFDPFNAFPPSARHTTTTNQLLGLLPPIIAQHMTTLHQSFVLPTIKRGVKRKARSDEPVEKKHHYHSGGNW